MKEVLTFFIPAIIGLNFYSKLKKDKLNSISTITKYGVLILLTNLIELGYLYFKDEFRENILLEMSDSVSFIFKYMLFGALISIVVGFIMYVVEKSVVLDVEVKKEQKSEKKQSKKHN